MIPQSDWDLLLNALIDAINNRSFFFYYVLFVAAVSSCAILYGFLAVFRYNRGKLKMFKESVALGAENEPRFIRWLEQDEIGFLKKLEKHEVKSLGFSLIIIFLIGVLFIYLLTIVPDELSNKAPLYTLIFIIITLWLPIAFYLLRLNFYTYLDIRSPVLRIRGPVELEAITEASNYKKSVFTLNKISLLIRFVHLKLYYFANNNNNTHNLKEIDDFISWIKTEDVVVAEYTPYTKIILKIYK